MNRINFIRVLSYLMFPIIGYSFNAFSLDLGVTWVGKSGMSDRVYKGFEARLSELAPDIKVEVKKELNDITDLKTVITSFEKSKDGLVVLRSNGVEYLASNTPKIPTFIGGCNDPRVLGAVKNLSNPEGNITGVTYSLPIDVQFETFLAILPNMKRLLLLTEKGHPSGDIDIENTLEVSKKLNLTTTSVPVSSKEEVVATVKKYAKNVDAIVIGNQAIVFDSAKEILAASGTIPVFSYSEKPVSDGALGGFVADDVKLGQMLAESVVDVYKNKKSINQIPVKVDPKPKFYVNVKTAGKLGIEVPFEILETATVIE